MTTTDNTPAVRADGIDLVPDHVVDRFPAFAADTRDELATLIAENFGGDESMSIADLTMVKLPSGTGAAIFGVKADGDTEGAKEISGVIATWQSRRNYWESSDVTGSMPDCFSRDGDTGIGAYGKGSTGNPTGVCESCPMNQWQEVGGKRVPPPCKPQTALLLMVEGEAFPWFIQVPRTSLRNFKTYRSGLLKKLKGVAQVVTHLTLTKEKGDGTPDFYVIKFTVGEDLGKAAKKAALELGKTFKPILLSSAVDRASASAAQDDTGGARPASAPVDEDGGHGVDFDKLVDDEPAIA